MSEYEYNKPVANDKVETTDPTPTEQEKTEERLAETEGQDYVGDGEADQEDTGVLTAADNPLKNTVHEDIPAPADYEPVEDDEDE